MDPAQCAVDGGYYLLAGRAAIARDIWTNVTYSAADTGEQLLSQLPSKTALLEPITDVDTIEDISALKRELPAKNFRNNGQKILLDYMVREFK